MLRKLISIVMTFALVFVIAAPAALAVTETGITETDIAKYKNGYIYTERADNWYLCIAAEPGGSVDVAIQYDNSPEYVYQTRLEFSSIAAQFPSESFWSKAKNAFFSSQHKQTIHTGVQAEMNSIAVQASATSIIISSKLRSYYGSNYSNVETEPNEKYSPYVVNVSESLTKEVYLTKNILVTVVMTVASILVSHNLPAKVGNLICAALGLGSVLLEVAAGTSIDCYKGVALFTRRGLVNGTPVVSATRSEIIYAVESGGVTKVDDHSEAETIYAPHEYDYEYSALERSAYETYRAIYG